MTNKPEKFRLRIVSAEDDIPRMLLAFGRGCGGEVALVFRPTDNSALLLHQVKGQPARVWRTSRGQAPDEPKIELASEDAVELLMQLKKDPPKAGPATLRGQWSGELLCIDGKPKLQLQRKVASYGTLRVESKPEGGWSATFERGERWFSEGKQQTVDRAALADAVTAGMGVMIGLVSEACSFRDTRKRAAVDPVHAEKHPARPKAPVKDPTERVKPLAEKKPAAGKKSSRQKRDADAPAAKRSDIPEPPACPVSVAKIASATTKDADALAELVQSLWGSTETPQLLSRAERLIKHATSLASSPLCTGSEQKRAFEDIERAAEAYKQARAALDQSEQKVVAKSLRQVAERVSLAAARVAKACVGQAKPKPVTPAAPPPSAKPARGSRGIGAAVVDPVKDALLMDAFSNAIAAAVKQTQQEAA